MTTLRLCADRVLIEADVEDRAPMATPSGLYRAASIAAAVEGVDPQGSWFVGTVVAVGPLVRPFEVRPYLRRRLTEVSECGHDLSPQELLALRDEVDRLPADGVEPIRVGDRVTFSWASGHQITINEVRYVILRAHDVLGVLIEDAA